MSDRSEARERRIDAAAGVVLVLALSITGYCVFQLVKDDGGAAPPAGSSSSSVGQSAQMAPSSTPTTNPAAGSEPTVEPADPAGEGSPREAARTAAARAPGQRGPEAEPRADEPTATTSAPAVEPTPTAEPPASPEATASAAAAASAPPPAIASSAANSKSAPAAVAPIIVGEFVDKVGPQFRLLGVECMLDGKSVYNGPGGRSVELFRRPSAPGKHSVSIVARYQGNGSGVFSYFEGYRFVVKGGRDFAANANGPTRITIAGVERGGNTAAFEDRLGLTVTVK